ncbi:MAG TPA: FHA domain-containing protein [Thermoanaerobaculia bacterium]|nr:FHA domain-containing protein [Thermoanaerobaculia bacterium]
MATCYTFGEFLLDCSAGELRRSGAPVDVRPKVYELLRYLVEHRGRLISKEELLDAVWGEVHVSDGSVNRTITELRHILGDDSRTPKIVETVARRGYRFIAEATATGETPTTLSEYVLLLADRTVPLRLGETIVGRIPECDVQIIGPSVSRRHARIHVAGREATIEDLGSTNGTFVAEVRISEVTPINDGDEIRIGKERLRLMNDRVVRARTEPAI